MDNRLFILKGESTAVLNEAASSPYGSEKRLQRIITLNPDLMKRIDNDASLYLVKWELPMYGECASSSAKSLDILLVDENAVPILVEVKRRSDQRIYREVVGQLLDYAWRSVKLDIDELREHFRENNAGNEETLYLDTPEFWQNVSENLASQKFKLVFAADEIPESLSKIIELLDRKMPDVSVYGVELKLYKHNEREFVLRSVVSSIEAVSETRQKKTEGEWGDDEFYEHLKSHGLEAVFDAFIDLRSFAACIGLDLITGKGKTRPTFIFKKGSQCVFAIESWKRQDLGFVCTAEIDTKKTSIITGIPAGEYIKRFYELPVPMEGEREKNYIRVTNDQIYIDLRALAGKYESNMAYFKDMIKLLKSDLMQKNS